MSHQEEWRPIPDYLGWYEASSEGQIRRVRSAKGAKVGRLLRQHLSRRHGRLSVTLSRGCATKTHWVHGLVATAFLGPVPEGVEVNHKDGDRTNNRAGNLEYTTRRENNAHAVTLGLIVPPRAIRGEKNPCAKLSDFDVRVIRRCVTLGMTQTSIAGAFGVDQTTVSDIKVGRRRRLPYVEPEARR